MNLKGLVCRELGEGLTEKELAAAVGVAPRMIIGILGDRIPKEPAAWKKFAKYFRMDADFLRTGRLKLAPSGYERAAHAVPMRKVPLLTWAQVGRMNGNIEPARITDPEALLETDVTGARTFALRVKDDSMYPMFGEGEVIFVNPDLKSEPGHYVVAAARNAPKSAMVRELNVIGTQHVLHPLNRGYKDMPLTSAYRILGKVVRLRKNL